MTDPKHEDIKEILAAFSLRAVTEKEEAEVQAHVAGCAECRTELQEYEETVAWLDESHPALPTDMADRVLRMSADERREQPSARTQGGRWLAVAAVVAFLLVGLWGAERYRSAERRAETAEAALSDLLLEGESLDFGKSDKIDARIVKTENRTLFIAANLPSIPDSKTYQLWVISDASPRSVKTFESRDGIAVEEIPVSEEAFEGALVTIEPAGGSKTPSLPPVISAP